MIDSLYCDVQLGTWHLHRLSVLQSLTSGFAANVLVKVPSPN